MLLGTEFEMGFWNAWIFMVPALVVILLTIYVMIKKGASGGKARVRHVSKITVIIASLSKFMLFPAAIYSVFLPLHFGTVWFYVGLLITLVGLVGTILILVGWARTSSGEPVTRGIYRYSRHPMYVTTFLLLLGVSISSASCIFLVFSIIMGAGAVYFIRIEEAQLIGHYGVEYIKYKARTPRWIGRPKSREE